MEHDIGFIDKNQHYQMPKKNSVVRATKIAKNQITLVKNSKFQISKTKEQISKTKEYIAL